MTRLPTRLAAVCVCAVLLAPAAAPADTLTTVSGKVYEGRVIRQEDDGVVFEVTSGGMLGRLHFPSDRIAKITYGLTAAEKQAKLYEARKADLNLATAEGWFQLAEWCTAQQMIPEALQAYGQSIARDASYRVKATLAQARLEIGRKRLRSAADLLEALLKTNPDNAEAKTELARLQAALRVELKGVFRTALRDYLAGRYVTALGLFRRVALDTDATLLAEIGRDLAARGEPSLAEMMIRCRMSDDLIDRPGTFEKVTALERPLLLARLTALVEAGLEAKGAAYTEVAGLKDDRIDERIPAADREVAALDRLRMLAEAAVAVAAAMKNDAAVAQMRGAGQAFAESQARMTLLMIEAVQHDAAAAVRAAMDDDDSFSERANAGEAALKRVETGQKALRKLVARYRDLSDQTRGDVIEKRKEFDELEKRLRQVQGHVRRIDTALDRALSEYKDRDWSDAAKWFGRLAEECSKEEIESVEQAVRRRTGAFLLDLMVKARIEAAETIDRFEKVSDYEKSALDRELSRQASKAAAQANEALHDARDAKSGSDKRRKYARRAVLYADRAIFFLEGRFQIGIDQSRRVRRNIYDDIEDMEDARREARGYL